MQIRAVHPTKDYPIIMNDRSVLMPLIGWLSAFGLALHLRERLHLAQADSPAPRPKWPEADCLLSEPMCGKQTLLVNDSARPSSSIVDEEIGSTKADPAHVSCRRSKADVR